MVIIDGLGKVTSMERTLENLNQYSRNKNKMNQHDLENELRQFSTTFLYDNEGKTVSDIKEAVFKIVKFNSITHIAGDAMCLSLRKDLNNAGKYGHASDEAWSSIRTGTQEVLFNKWYMEIYNKVKIPKEIITNIQNLNKGTNKKSNRATPAATASDKQEFRNELYDLLYEKENWQSLDGGKHRLMNYVSYLAKKIFSTDKDAVYLQFNKKRERFAYNSRLLSKYGNYIVISAIQKNEEFEQFKLIKSISIAEELGFKPEVLQLPPIPFFRHVDDIIFRGTIQDFDLSDTTRLAHIIEERRNRLPDSIKDMSTLDISMRINMAIEIAVKIAQIDYNFIIPTYDHTSKTISFLLPIYTSFGENKRPECALVIARNKEKKWEPRTVLTLDAAYRGARLISRLDQGWLRLD